LLSTDSTKYTDVYSDIGSPCQRRCRSFYYWNIVDVFSTASLQLCLTSWECPRPGLRFTVLASFLYSVQQPPLTSPGAKSSRISILHDEQSKHALTGPFEQVTMLSRIDNSHFRYARACNCRRKYPETFTNCQPVTGYLFPSGAERSTA
jgi:hypothetical protein